MLGIARPSPIKVRPRAYSHPREISARARRSKRRPVNRSANGTGRHPLPVLRAVTGEDAGAAGPFRF
jgi:hypothetical protein